MLTIPMNLKHAVNRDGAIILDTPNNAMTPLNSTGAYIWQRLERGILLGDIVKELASETGVEQTIVAADVDRFIDELKARRLLLES